MYSKKALFFFGGELHLGDAPGVGDGLGFRDRAICIRRGFVRVSCRPRRRRGRPGRTGCGELAFEIGGEAFAVFRVVEQGVDVVEKSFFGE